MAAQLLDRPASSSPGGRRGGARLLLWPLLAGGLLVLAAIVGTVLAITGGGLGCVGGGGGGAGSAPSKAAVAQIAPERLAIYEQAGARFHIDWAFLASIGMQECASGTCAGVNADGCAGPMQIAYLRGSPCSPGSGPTLWERFKVAAEGGSANVNDLADAIFTAARILRQADGAPATGGAYHAYYEAACHYYGACAQGAVHYAAEVMARAVSYGFGSATGAQAGDGAEGESSPSSAECGSTAGAGSGAGAAIVRVAVSQIGESEHPPGSNCTKYGPCEEWCALFVSWVWQRAGVPMVGGTSPYAYSGTLYLWAASHGGRDLPPSATPAPGDAVFYGSGPSDSAHVGIVERVFPDGGITTVEGNYSNEVHRNGPFLPAHAVQAGEPAPIYGYAQPPTSSQAASGA